MPELSRVLPDHGLHPRESQTAASERPFLQAEQTAVRPAGFDVREALATTSPPSGGRAGVRGPCGPSRHRRRCRCGCSLASWWRRAGGAHHAECATHRPPSRRSSWPRGGVGVGSRRERRVVPLWIALAQTALFGPVLHLGGQITTAHGERRAEATERGCDGAGRTAVGKRGAYLAWRGVGGTPFECRGRQVRVLVVDAVAACVARCGASLPRIRRGCRPAADSNASRGARGNCGVSVSAFNAVGSCPRDGCC